MNPFKKIIQGPLNTRSTRWAVLAVIIVTVLWIHFVTGPMVLVPPWLVLPIVIAAWYDGILAGSLLAIGLPLICLSFIFFWLEAPWPANISYINFGIRVSAMEVLALVVSRSGTMSRELRVLRGLLPICMYCHRIRTEANDWEKLEVYLARHSQARFTHAICTHCQPGRS
jgi:hypothetical protein